MMFNILDKLDAVEALARLWCRALKGQDGRLLCLIGMIRLGVALCCWLGDALGSVVEAFFLDALLHTKLGGAPGEGRVQRRGRRAGRGGERRMMRIRLRLRFGPAAAATAAVTALQNALQGRSQILWHRRYPRPLLDINVFCLYCMP